MLEQRLRVVLHRAARAKFRNSCGKLRRIKRAIGEHVGHAARYAQIVFQHDELAVIQPKQICARHRDVDVAGHLHASHLAAEVPAAIHQFAGNYAVVENLSFVVNVAQKEVERGDPLRQIRVRDATSTPKP